MGKRWYFIGLSLAPVCVASASRSSIPGPNSGTDFKGGTEVEVAFKKPVDAGDVRAAVEEHGFARSPDVVPVADAREPEPLPHPRPGGHRRSPRRRRTRSAKRMCLPPRATLRRPSARRAARRPRSSSAPAATRSPLRYERTRPTSTAITAEQLTGVPAASTLRQAREQPAWCVSERDHKVEIQLKSQGRSAPRRPARAARRRQACPDAAAARRVDRPQGRRRSSATPPSRASPSRSSSSWSTSRSASICASRRAASSP